jgi:hypothetical protein
MSENESNWGIVELMGHKTVSGRIQKSEMLGKPMLRIDVPETSAYPEFTQFYGDSAIYCVTFTSEEVARLAAEQCQINPVSVYCPDLVTVKEHKQIVRELKRRLYAARSLPEPADDIGPQAR